MKRIAQTLLAISFATAAAATFASTPSYPSSADETTSISSEFPNIRSYADMHRNDAGNQQLMTFPSAGLQEYPLSGEFPNLRSYADIHRNDPVVVSSTSTFPASPNATTSMAEEGLVPGLNSGPSTYASGAQPTHN
ncbi:MAG: hypothetical protein ACXWCP_23235 [Burkholderiales bacterium]